MSIHILDQLEAKIEMVIETIEMLRLEIEDLEEKNTSLTNENTNLKSRQAHWEQGLTKLLSRIEDVEPIPQSKKNNSVETFEEHELVS